jgi:hypothetical protein
VRAAWMKLMWGIKETKLLEQSITLIECQGLNDDRNESISSTLLFPRFYNLET